MIAVSLVVVVAVAAVVCEQGVMGQLFRMSVQDDGDFLEKMKPSITEVSKEIAAAVNGGDDLEHIVTSVITKDLVMQVKKLKEVFNDSAGSSTNENCYQCTECITAAVSCGGKCSCCVDGFKGCFYISCRTGERMRNVQRVESVGMTSSLTSWLESSKTTLMSDVTQSVIATIKESDRCCSCSMCRRNSSSSESNSCCVDGDDCTCQRRSTTSIDLIASTVLNPKSLSPEIEKSLYKVGNLIDKLPLFVK